MEPGVVVYIRFSSASEGLQRDAPGKGSGYMFIRPARGRDIFLHCSTANACGVGGGQLRVGTKVRFEAGVNRREGNRMQVSQVELAD